MRWECIVPDYKEMYLKLFRATEEAISCLIDAQRECEEMYISAPEHEKCLYLYPRENDGEKSK